MNPSTMTEAELHDVVTNCASEVSILSKLVRTALHYLDRVRELEARDDRTGVGQALGQDEHVEESLISCAQRVRAERDSARRERDDAQARVRELEAMSSTATIRDARKAIDDARAILGARDDEMLSDAAARVMADLGSGGVPVNHTYAGDSTEVVIRITSRDPALLSLPLGARLALVRLP